MRGWAVLAWAVPVESQTAMRCACWRATRHMELRYMYLVYERLASILPCIPIPHHSHSLRVPRRASNRHHSISLGISAAFALKTWSTPGSSPMSTRYTFEPGNMVLLLYICPSIVHNFEAALSASAQHSSLSAARRASTCRTLTDSSQPMIRFPEVVADAWSEVRL